MTVRFVGTNCQAGVEEKDAAIGPGCEQTAFVGRWSEGRIVIFEAGVDVFQGRGSRGRGPHGEGEAVGLVVVVVGVLAEDDGFHCVEGGVTGPESQAISIL